MNRMAASCTLAIALIGLIGTFPCAKAQVPISGLPAASTPVSGSEVAPIVQGGVTKNVGLGNIIPNSGVTAGSYGDASHCAAFTVRANGTLTSASQSTSCPGGGGGGTPGGSNTQLQYNNSGTFGGITGATSNGTSVTLTSPTLVTPALGTPASGNLSNTTSFPTANLSGLGTGVASALSTGVSGTGAICLASGSACSPSGSSLTVGTTTITGGANTKVEMNNSGVLGEYTVSGTGNVAMTNSPTLVTPTLGTPASATLTNATGLPISSGVSGLGTGVATALGSSASGSGSLCLTTNCTMVTPTLGTPTSATLTNATGLPVSTGVSGLGTGVASALAISHDTSGGVCTVGGSGCPGGGSVTSVATGACLTGGTITTTGTLAGTYITNAQTGTYTIQGSDACKRVSFSVTSATAVSLPQATGSFGSGFSFDIWNTSGGAVVTVTPTTSTIDGKTSLPFPPDTGCTVASDGTNWQVSNCTALDVAAGTTTLSLSGGTFTPNGTNRNYAITLSNACPCTMANPSPGLQPGTQGLIEVSQDGTGSRTIGTYGSNYIYQGGTSTISLSTGSSDTDYLPYYVIDSSHILLTTLSKNPTH